ncbi:MAG: hypothetical protein ACWGQW_00220 [bacterium]
MASKPKLVEVTTPIGTLRWPKLHEPDYGSSDYPNPLGAFSTKLVLKKDDPETQAFLAAIKPAFEEAVAQGKEKFNALSISVRKKLGAPKIRDVYIDLYDEETEQPTGEIEISAKMRYGIEVKKGPKAGTIFHRWPHIVDAHGNQMDPVPPIGSGSEGRIRVELAPYWVAAEGVIGLSLRLVGVQITQLVMQGKRTASSMGFDEVADGYVYNPDDVPEDDGGPLKGFTDSLEEFAGDVADELSNVFGGGPKSQEQLDADSALHDELFGTAEEPPKGS